MLRGEGDLQAIICALRLCQWAVMKPRTSMCKWVQEEQQPGNTSLKYGQVEVEGAPAW